MPPVNHARHGEPHFRLSVWLGNYVLKTAGVQGGDNSTVRLDLDNEPQPDLLLRILTECGVDEGAVDWFVLRAGRYERLEADGNQCEGECEL